MTDLPKNEQLRILYMEDNQGQARLFQRKLRRLGFYVEIASDGEQGLERTANESFDVVVVDLNLPIFDGMQVLRKMRERGSLPLTIMLTGMGDEVLAVEAMKLGAEDYLVKDVDGRYLELFPSILQNLLRNQHNRDEKEEAIRALKQSEEKFRAMFEFAPFGMVLCDKRGHILRFNDAFCQIVEKEAQILQQSNLNSLLFGTDRCLHILEELGKNGSIAPFEIEYHLSNNVYLWLQISGTTYKKLARQERVWLFVEDVTERKAMFDELIQSSKLKAVGELAANIAHEMNNPLGIISAKARLLLSHESDNMSQKVSRELGKMIDQCDRLARLTRSILDYSRPSLRIQRAVNILEPLKRAVEMIKKRAQERGIQLNEVYHPTLLQVEGNSQELEQVFLNLLLNAIEAMAEGGSLTLSTSVCSEHSDSRFGDSPVISIQVQDKGEGISPDILPYIFEPFYTTKEEGRGTGLGLSICHGLIRSHKGTINVSSDEGKGTIFEILLPVLQKNT